MSLVLDRRSKSKLSGTSFSERTYIRSKKNCNLLKHLADEKEWPVIDHTKQISIAKEDIGMIKFMKMISSQDRSGPLLDDIALSMKNLATSSSMTNLFQVLYHFLGFIILAQPFLLCGFRQSNPCFYPTQTILIYSNQSLTLGGRLWSSEQNEIESKKSRTCRLFQFVIEFWRFTNNQQEVSCLVKSCVHTFSQWWHQHFHVRISNWHNWSHFRSFWFFCF